MAFPGGAGAEREYFYSYYPDVGGRFFYKTRGINDFNINHKNFWETYDLSKSEVY